jgi:hypothetical protein
MCRAPSAIPRTFVCGVQYVLRFFLGSLRTLRQLWRLSLGHLNGLEGADRDHPTIKLDRRRTRLWPDGLELVLARSAAECRLLDCATSQAGALGPVARDDGEFGANLSTRHQVEPRHARFRRRGTRGAGVWSRRYGRRTGVQPGRLCVFVRARSSVVRGPLSVQRTLTLTARTDQRRTGWSQKDDGHAKHGGAVMRPKVRSTECGGFMRDERGS